jgi:Arc/MetJ family transcription regulator
MISLLQLLKSLFPRAEPRPDVDDAFLADAVDIYDLERRQRALDDRSRNPFGGIAFGLHAR